MDVKRSQTSSRRASSAHAPAASVPRTEAAAPVGMAAGAGAPCSCAAVSAAGAGAGAEPRLFMPVLPLALPYSPMLAGLLAAGLGDAAAAAGEGKAAGEGEGEGEGEEAAG